MPQNRTSTSKGLSSSMFTSWVSGETTTLGNITTSWYSPTIDPNWMPTVTTYTANTTWSSLMAERTQYCWFTGDEDSDYDGDVFIPEDDLSEECYSLYESYCDIGPEDPIPQSPKSTIPKTCTPVPSTEVPSSTMSTPTSTGVTTPTPTLSGMAQGCSKFHKVVKDEGCQSIADNAGISETDFLSWNDIDDDCTNLKYDYYVCIGKPASTSETATSTGITTPKPTQTGMADGCDRFHKVVKDEGCQSIADDSKISLDDFLSWNPDVGDTCTNLKYDFYVCVGKPTSTSGSATSTGITTPKPTQTGMADGCDRFHKVVKDEDCQSIADDSKISLDDFLSWNPDVGGTCTNLKYDFYVCVHRSPSLATSTNVAPTLTTTTGGTTPTPTQTGMVAGCTAFHKVEQGEWCQLIADDSKISLKDLLAWNPDVGSDCTNLKYDFYVCVGK
ncbi:hypothetical protein PENARI_c029G03566 [Penicillium arizonense]|uniref:LysM domain-containing protein n=1 Tax=Penicillium arizonense TaxID=1835702 RepID=A0A1F5L575_PENAI|nr:hypothetical protein PENARI_c029G03566 [Penicillium arizonense]OGE48352.1 hypothetical protein PENARI_c029G03566 [Penicillium arizonense]